MMYLFQLLILFIFLIYCQCFFKNSPLQLNTITPRLNLTCASDFGSKDLFTNCEYCVYEFVSNGTDSTVSHDCIYITNSYRLVTQRCTGFTTTTDVGYGLCSKLPFEYYDIDLLCICATDLCNENFTTCKQSVDLNPKLPVLPSPIPLLTKQISPLKCQDTSIGILNSTYYCVRDTTPYIDINQCEEFVKNHTVLCMYLERNNGSYLTLVAVPDEDYEYVLAEQIQLMQRMVVKSNVEQYYNETKSSFYVQWKEQLSDTIDDVMINDTLIYNKCFCLTNDCNMNLTTCLQSSFILNKTNKNEGNIIWTIVIGLFFINNLFWI